MCETSEIFFLKWKIFSDSVEKHVIQLQHKYFK
jgi:hypothetical protein